MGQLWKREDDGASDAVLQQKIIRMPSEKDSSAGAISSVNFTNIDHCIQDVRVLDFSHALTPGKVGGALLG